MAGSSAEIEREIAETRRHLDAQVVELRRRGRIQARRLLGAAVLVAGTAAAVGIGMLVYRLSRPMTWRERAGRLLPSSLPRQLPSWRRRRSDKAQQRVVVEPQQRSWERLALSLARAAGTAAGAAIVSRMLQRRSPS
jgi:hypothetical protein